MFWNIHIEIEMTIYIISSRVFLYFHINCKHILTFN